MSTRKKDERERSGRELHRHARGSDTLRAALARCELDRARDEAPQVEARARRLAASLGRAVRAELRRGAR